MARARLAAYAAFLVVLLLGAAGSPPSARPVALGAAAAVTWPPSTGLLVAEIVTGGVSASDEYVELANAGPTSADLAGLEVAYVTSSGATVTRKTSWTTTRIVGPGQRVLIANSAGIFAGAADATYSGGIAATGGSLVLRPTGGTPIDAVGWGDAVNTFVEGTARPPRRRVGRSSACPADQAETASTRTTTRATSSATPHRSRKASGAVRPRPRHPPRPSPTHPDPDGADPDPDTHPDRGADPDPDTHPDRGADPDPEPHPAHPDPDTHPDRAPTRPRHPPLPGADPDPDTDPDRCADPDAHAGADRDRYARADTCANPDTGADPAPAVVTSIAEARALPDDVQVTIEGTLTTGLGVLESGRTGFVQDATAGIALYLTRRCRRPFRRARSCVSRVCSTAGSRCVCSGWPGPTCRRSDRAPSRSRWRSRPARPASQSRASA